MKNGTCIKCNSPNVYVKDYEVTAITLNGKPVPNKSYLCTNCGYFETYITDQGALGNIVTRAEKLRDWKKAP